MRLRALPLLLVLTAGDYALWDWSIADGHDILSLISGLTLLPLAAATLAVLALGIARALGVILERPTTRRTLARAQAPTHADTAARTPADSADQAERKPPSRRLAA